MLNLTINLNLINVTTITWILELTSSMEMLHIWVLITSDIMWNSIIVCTFVTGIQFVKQFQNLRKALK